MKRDKWTIDDLPSPATPEDDRFDRKQFSSDEQELKASLAKALSAFANSGGGHIFLGISDDGALHGVPAKMKGRQSAKDWVENLVYASLEPPLQAFRVHEIDIPIAPDEATDRQIIVIDVADSEQAPHQVAKSGTYFHRASGKSIPAPDFYLRLLSGRRTRPRIEIGAPRVYLLAVSALPHGTSVSCAIETRVKNIGDFAARNLMVRWSVLNDAPLSVSLEIESWPDQIQSEFDSLMGRKLVLPGSTVTIVRPLSISLPSSITRLAAELPRLLDHRALVGDLRYRSVSEVHVGDVQEVELESIISLSRLRSQLEWMLPHRMGMDSGYAGWGVDYGQLSINNGRVKARIQSKSKHAYRRVQFQLWILNSEAGELQVVPLVGSTELAPGMTKFYDTSIGDVILPENGERWLVASNVSPVPSIYLSEQ